MSVDTGEHQIVPSVPQPDGTAERHLTAVPAIPATAEIIIPADDTAPAFPSKPDDGLIDAIQKYVQEVKARGERIDICYSYGEDICASCGASYITFDYLSMQGPNSVYAQLGNGTADCKHVTDGQPVIVVCDDKSLQAELQQVVNDWVANGSPSSAS